MIKYLTHNWHRFYEQFHYGLLFIPVFLTFIPIISKFHIVPSRLQTTLEFIYEFLEEQFKPMFHSDKDYKKWMPFFLTIFYYILVENLIGIIPGIHGLSAQISFTASLAVLVLIISLFVGIKQQGIVKFMANQTPSDIGLPIRIFMFPIEMFSKIFARPFALSLRLFANMMAGHTVITMLLSLTHLLGTNLVLPLDITLVVVMLFFEILVALLQAFIFAYLSGLYISESLYEGH